MNFYIFVDTDKNTLQNMLTFLSRIFKEADEAAEERLKMPIVPLYLSLLAFSYWRPLSIFLLSKNTIEEKISIIDKLYVNWTYWDHIWVVISMLLLASLSSALFPLLMWLLDWILLKPIGKRKFYNNETKKLDMLTDLQATQHKYEKNKILSGNKEVEDYNKSIDDLTKSYEDRIKSLENVSMQKEQNWEKEKILLDQQYNKSLETNVDLQKKLITVERGIEQLVEDKIENSKLTLKSKISMSDVNAFSYLSTYPELSEKMVAEKMVIDNFSSQELRFIKDVLKTRNLLFYKKLRSVLFSNDNTTLLLNFSHVGDEFLEEILLTYNIGTKISTEGWILEYRISDNNRLIHRLYDFLILVSPLVEKDL